MRAVVRQAQETGTKMICTINHPNFKWALTAEDIASLPESRFMEIFNSGHRLIYNEGEGVRVSVERMWDVVLTQRLAELNLGLVYGVAADDAHHYHRNQIEQCMGVFRGWVCVRSAFLTPESLLTAMEAGDFYASTGVVLEDVRYASNQLQIAIQPEAGVSYKTQFIGTRKGYDPVGKPVFDEEGKELRTTLAYSDEIGAVLAEAEGTNAAYTLTDKDIYVRAKVVSSKPRKIFTDAFEVAWVQPVVPSQG
jgi:hypothetical protein